MCGSATLAIAVSSSSMKVASVTTTATIQGLIGGRSAAASGTEMEAAAGLMGAPACFDATRDRSVSYNFQWNSISGQVGRRPGLEGLKGERATNPAWESFATQLRYFLPSRDQHDARHVNEQAVLHHARHVAEPASERWRVRDLAEAAVENVMAFVRDKRAAVGLAKLHQIGRAHV